MLAQNTDSSDETDATAIEDQVLDLLEMSILIWEIIASIMKYFINFLSRRFCYIASRRVIENLL